MPFQRIAKVGPVIVAGGTIDTVTNPVDTDPTATIATVTSSVPFPNRDAFYWPAISGETFPPTLGAGSGYRWSDWGSPSVAAGGAAGVVYPALPRIGYNGNATMTFSVNGWMEDVPFPVAAGTYICGIWVGDLVNWRTGFVYKGNNTGPFGADIYTRDGSNDALVLANQSNKEIHLFEVVLTSAGDIDWKIDGAVVKHRAGAWPVQFAGMAKPQWILDSSGLSGSKMCAARLQAAWTP